MLLRIENLRQTVIRMHSQLQQNRSSLRAIRQDFQQSSPHDESAELLALPASPSSPSLARRSQQAGDGITVTCDITTPFITAELKNVLDEEEKREVIDRA